MPLVEPDLFYRRLRKKREEDERMRAEYFANGGVVHKYPPAARGSATWVRPKWNPTRRFPKKPEPVDGKK